MRLLFTCVVAFGSQETFALLGTADYDILAVVLDEKATGQKALEVFKNIDAWLGDLNAPPDLQFATACESFSHERGVYGLAYDPQTNLIQYHGLHRYAQQHHDTFLAHEYGHAIFRANIGIVNPSTNGHLDKSLKFREVLRGELSQVSQTKCRRSPAEPSVEFLGLQKEFLELDYFTFGALRLGAYDELFADIVAVLYSGHGDAVYRAVGGEQTNWTQKYYISLPEGYRGRDFTYALSMSEWSDNSRYMSFYDFLGAKSDMYNVLDPVRSYLWERYLKSLPRSQYSGFFKAYLLAVGVEYKRYMNENIWEQPVRDMNERFIKSLDEQMAAAGLAGEWN